LASLLLARVDDASRISIIWQAGRELSGQAQGIVDLAQEQSAAVGRDLRGIKLDNDGQLGVERKGDLWGTLCLRGSHGLLRVKLFVPRSLAMNCPSIYSSS